MPAVLDDATRNSLLGSIEAGNLILLCGAGLSIPPPSNLLPAAEIARRCYDRYSATVNLAPAMREDIEALANHFLMAGQFPTVFIRLLPWNDLVGEPNVGHASVADMLVTQSVHAAVSTNVDGLIEQWAQRRKVALRGAIHGGEVAAVAGDSAPFLKLHGCFCRGPEETVWTPRQLESEPIAGRTGASARWLELNLPNKDLLVLGFWTDWSYLNRVIESVLPNGPLVSVTVVDILAEEQLRAKAPALWDTLRRCTTRFTRIQGSATDALEELRVAFSRGWVRKFLRLGAPLMQTAGLAYSEQLLEAPELSAEVLYDLRRDGEGVPYSRAARAKEPGALAAQAAFTHLLLLNAGAARKDAWFQHRGRSVRVVNGAGRELGQVRDSHREPPALPQPDVVVCSGATDLGIPARVIAEGLGSSAVRPAPGGTSAWLTLEGARQELSL